MSELHTNGRLSARDEWLVPEDQVSRPIGGSTDKVKDREHYANVVTTVSSKYHDDRANARRLAACWNAWVGVSTEDIEATGGVAWFKGKPVGELAEARALLVAVMEAGGSVESFALDERIRAFLEPKGGA